MELTFDQLPKAVSQLAEELKEIKRLILLLNNPTKNHSEELLNVERAAEFLHLSVQTIYGLVSKSQIPNMKRGRRLYFSKKDLTIWVNLGRRLTANEAESRVDILLESARSRRQAAA